MCKVKFYVLQDNTKMITTVPLPSRSLNKQRSSRPAKQEAKQTTSKTEEENTWGRQFMGYYK